MLPGRHVVAGFKCRAGSGANATSTKPTSARTPINCGTRSASAPARTRPAGSPGRQGHGRDLQEANEHQDHDHLQLVTHSWSVVAVQAVQDRLRGGAVRAVLGRPRREREQEDDHLQLVRFNRSAAAAHAAQGRLRRGRARREAHEHHDRGRDQQGAHEPPAHGPLQHAKNVRPAAVDCAVQDRLDAGPTSEEHASTGAAPATRRKHASTRLPGLGA